MEYQQKTSQEHTLNQYKHETWKIKQKDESKNQVMDMELGACIIRKWKREREGELEWDN
jgi:hypothetical protein